jgi:hypothetical protein
MPAGSATLLAAPTPATGPPGPPGTLPHLVVPPGLLYGEQQPLEGPVAGQQRSQHRCRKGEHCDQEMRLLRTGEHSLQLCGGQREDEADTYFLQQVRGGQLGWRHWNRESPWRKGGWQRAPLPHGMETRRLTMKARR